MSANADAIVYVVMGVHLAVLTLQHLSVRSGAAGRKSDRGSTRRENYLRRVRGQKVQGSRRDSSCSVST